VLTRRAGGASVVLARGVGVLLGDRRAWMAAARARASTKSGEAAARKKEPVAAHPQKSNRAIAAETGVAFKTVARARASGVPNDTPEKTIGLDGKSYLLGTRPVIQWPIMIPVGAAIRAVPDRAMPDTAPISTRSGTASQWRSFRPVCPPIPFGASGKALRAFRMLSSAALHYSGRRSRARLARFAAAFSNRRTRDATDREVKHAGTGLYRLNTLRAELLGTPCTRRSLRSRI
jgi:hypothetical protein